MNKVKITEEFKRIKDLGFVKSRRKNNTGIGKTFEDYLGVIENNNKSPDFEGFEVKSKRALSSSFLTLFTKSPSGPSGANTFLRDSFGEFYEDYPNLKNLHTSIFSDKFNSYRGTYGFKIENDVENKKIFIVVKEIKTGNIIDKTVYWEYDDLQKVLHNKLEGLFYVNAETKLQEDEEYFHYTTAKIFINPSLERFLELINKGKIMVDIRIGSYKSGKNKGKTHDHGTGFRLKPSDLYNLYSEVVDVE